MLTCKSQHLLGLHMQAGDHGIDLDFDDNTIVNGEIGTESLHRIIKLVTCTQDIGLGRHSVELKLQHLALGYPADIVPSSRIPVQCIGRSVVVECYFKFCLRLCHGKEIGYRARGYQFKALVVAFFGT